MGLFQWLERLVWNTKVVEMEVEAFEEVHEPDTVTEWFVIGMLVTLRRDPPSGCINESVWAANVDITRRAISSAPLQPINPPWRIDWIGTDEHGHQLLCFEGVSGSYAARLFREVRN